MSPAGQRVLCKLREQPEALRRGLRGISSWWTGAALRIGAKSTWPLLSSPGAVLRAEKKRCGSCRLNNKMRAEGENGHGCHDCLNRWVLVSKRNGTTQTLFPTGQPQRCGSVHLAILCALHTWPRDTCHNLDTGSESAAPTGSSLLRTDPSLAHWPQMMSQYLDASSTIKAQCAPLLNRAISVG